MMLNLPFFDFFGLVKGASILNILIYEALAFILVFSFLMIALKLVMFTTSVFEKILSATIVLGLPSKILGAVVGMVKNYVLVFIALYRILLLGLSIFFLFCIFTGVSHLSNNEFISSSKYKNSILSSTPVLSSFTDKSTNDFAISMRCFD